MTRARGFTLIELAIAMVIMAVLLALALPSYTTYIENAKVRTAAQAFLSGLQTARSEAVNRNTSVQFLLTDNDPIDDNVAIAVASSTGRNWMIRTSDMTTFIEGKYGAEGTGPSGSGGTLSVQVCPLQTDGTCGATSSVTFNGLGATTLASAVTFEFSNPAAGTCAAGGGKIRCLDVTISAGGLARLCDPAISTAAITAGDTRGC